VRTPGSSRRSIAPTSTPTLIIPKQFLKSIKRSGFGPNLFDEWRYLDDGEPGMDDCAATVPNPDFVLNQPRYSARASCWRARTSAAVLARARALGAADFGFRVVIAPSFADIFFNNCFKNGLLPIVLKIEVVDRLFCRGGRHEGYRLTVDLPQQESCARRTESRLGFEIDAVPQALPAERARRYRAHAAGRRRDPRLRGAPPAGQAPWLFVTRAGAIQGSEKPMST
jgi:3-isopropylmalate/(R)-2-methylmalate dehydratase small subunit